MAKSKQLKKKRVKKVKFRAKRLSGKAQAITIWRLFKNGFRNLFRNAWLSTAATAIMFVTLSVIAIGGILSYSLNTTVEQITEEVALEVFLNDIDNQEDQRSALRAAIEADENVKNIEFISKEQAIERFRADNADKPAILRGFKVAGQDLPESYRVFVFDLTKIDSSIDTVLGDQHAQIVDEINFDDDRKESIDRIAEWQDFIVVAAVAMGSVFGAISILIIFNTIRMAIYTRSYEIEIMKLIGATPGYIRSPFLIEASLYGIIAGILTLALVYSAVLTALPRLGDFIAFDETADLLTEYWYVSFAVIIGLGILIGFISAVIAMAKYLAIKKW